jgi:hypothetical protein
VFVADSSSACQKSAVIWGRIGSGGHAKLYETRTVGTAAAICLFSRTQNILRKLLFGAIQAVNRTAAMFK